MKNNLLFFVAIIMFASTIVNGQVPERKGLWKFDEGDLLKAEIGNALELTGTQTPVAGPAANDNATTVTRGSFLTMRHGIAPNGGGSRVNEWTLQFDFLVPSIEPYSAFFQCDMSNETDADLFVHNGDGKIGTTLSTYSENTISANTWYRMLVTVKQGSFFRVYIDGVLWLDAPDITSNSFNLDARWSLDHALMIFGDNDGEDSDIYCSEIAIWDCALTEEEASELGDIIIPKQLRNTLKS